MESKAQLEDFGAGKFNNGGGMIKEIEYDDAGVQEATENMMERIGGIFGLFV